METARRTRHVKYFKRCLTSLPEQYISLDLNRMTLLYFCVVALDLLGALEEVNH